MFRKVLLISALVISLISTGCPGGSGGSSNKHVERDFYIESHEIVTVWRPCGFYGLDGGSGSADEILQEGDPAQSEDFIHIIYPYNTYVLIVEYFNDQDNTEWISLETFVDGKRWSSAGSLIKGKYVKSMVEEQEGHGKAVIDLVDRVPWNWVGKDVTFDVWLEDENGVKSEVYTIDVKVMPNIWYDKPTTS